MRKSIKIFRDPLPALGPLSEWTDPHLGPHSIPLNYAVALGTEDVRFVRIDMRLLHRTVTLDLARCVKHES